MGIYFYDGGILFDSGSVAFDEDCCCGGLNYCQGCSVLTPSDRPTITVNGFINGTHSGLPPTTCYDCPGDCVSMDGVPVATTSFSSSSCVAGPVNGSCLWMTDNFVVKCYWYSSCLGTTSDVTMNYRFCISHDEENGLCYIRGAINGGLTAVFQTSVDDSIGFGSSPITIPMTGQSAGGCALSSGATMVIEW